MVNGGHLRLFIVVALAFQCILILWCTAFIESSNAVISNLVLQFRDRLECCSSAGNDAPLVAGRNYSLVIYVRTSPKEFRMRQVLRELWISEIRAMGAVVLFASGTSENKTVNRQLQVRPSNEVSLMKISE